MAARAERQQYTTLVVKIVDREAYKAWSTPLMQSMADEQPVNGVVLVGMSIGDELSHVEDLEGLLEAEGISFDRPDA